MTGARAHQGGGHTGAGPVTLVMGTAGHVPGHHVPGHMAGGSAEAFLDAVGANAGNLMFQYAATRILAGPLVHLGQPGADWGDARLHGRAGALVFPAANHLRTGADWRGLTGYLGRPGPPLTVLGLGVQARQGAGVSETVAALRADPWAARLVEALQARARLITVRGPFSQAVCEGLGLTGTRPLGCPSALLHPAPDLGRRIAARLAGVAAALRGKGAPVRPALAAAAPFEIRGNAAAMAVEQKLFSWIVAERGGTYVQQSGGVAAIEAASGGGHRLAASTRAGIEAVLAPGMAPDRVWSRLTRAGYVPSCAAGWIARLTHHDLVIGSRVHGVMAALAAGVPGVLVAHDARTEELGRTMHLPCLSRAELCAAETLGAALAAVRFDGPAFDRWRRQAAGDLAAHLAGAGIATTPHLAALAGPVAGPVVGPAAAPRRQAA